MIDLYLFVLCPLIIAIVMYLSSGKYMKYWIMPLQTCMFAGAFINFLFVKRHGTLIHNIGGWENFAGIRLKADILSSAMVLLTTFLLMMLLFYDFSKDHSDKIFSVVIMILQGLIIGIFLSNDIFNIFVLIEVATITISIMLMLKKESRTIYDGLLYLLVNIVAMTFFLFGAGFLYKIFGIFDMDGIKELMPLAGGSNTVIIAYSLMITAVSLKSALLPLFSWLPRAHATPGAPTIVSALLSGLYVKIGVYLFIRFQDMFSPVINTSSYFMLLGFLTGVAGFILALSQTDIKLILAYHTISQIGLILIGLGYAGTVAYWGSVYHIISHAVFKSTLFLTSGIIIEEYGTRNIKKIKGLFKRMPLVSVSALMAVLGITGAPFFNGSISKHLIKEGVKGSFFEYGLILISLGTVISFVKYSSMFFGGSESAKTKVAFCRKFITMSMGLLCFIGGILGHQFIWFLFKIDIEFQWTEYLRSSLLFILTLITGYLVYKKIVLKSGFLSKIKTLELSFNNICAAITLFFFMTMLYSLLIA